MERRFIHPLRRIAEACGISERSVYRWIKYHGLPVFHTPSGKVATTVGLLEQWARERVDAEAARPRNSGRSGQGYEAAERLRVRLRRVESVEG